MYDHFALLVDAVQDHAVFLMDPGGRVVSWSAGSERLYGYPAEEIVGEPLSRLYDPGDDTGEAARVDLAAASRYGKHQSLAWRARKNGSLFWGQSDLVATRNGGGDLTGYGNVTRDLADLRRLDLRLAEVEGLAQLGSWEWDVPNGTVEWTEQLYRIYGLDPESHQPTFEGYLRRVHPDDRVRVRTIIEGAFADQLPFAFDERIVRPDGSVRILASQGHVYADGQGHPIRMVGACRDVTEHRKAEEQLATSEARYRLLAENSTDVIVLAAPDGTFRYVSPASNVLLGYRPGELEGHSAYDFFPSEDIERLRQAHAALLDSPETVTERHRFRRKDGSMVWVESKFRRVTGSSGEVVELQGSIRDITERKRVEERLEHLAAHDPLTDLINRRRFQEELATTVAYTLRYSTPAALLVLDLDHFKFVNDTLGHAAGDALLIRLGRLVQGRLRETDVLGRLGGDEFAVILRNVDRQDAETMAAEMRELIRSCRPPEEAGPPPRLSASVGIALIEPEITLDAEGLLAEADIAMYEAKEAGRDRAAVADLTRERPPKFMARLSWADRIRAALEDDGFVLMAQPIANWRDPSEERHELLIRMRGVDGELIEPGAFLYIAERFGLIQDIDRWVVQQAVGILERAGDSGLKLHVNLSGASLESEEVRELVRETVAEAPIDPRDLTFEVTETAAIVNIDQARGFAEALADLGCSLALDDFGSGFGSLYYLKRLPFDFLKIDGDFVRHLTTSSADQVTVKAVIEIARGLGKQTIAEWVEDEETKVLLTTLKIDYLQGFHLGAPEPTGGLAGSKEPA